MSKFPASTDVLSVAQIRRRLVEVQKSAEHLRRRLPLDSPHNAVLRLKDIARYIGVTTTRLCAQMRGGPVSEARQVELSRCFRSWDNGNLVKALYQDVWQLVHRHGRDSTLAPLDAENGAQISPPKVIQMRIDVTALGLKLKGK